MLVLLAGGIRVPDAVVAEVVGRQFKVECGVGVANRQVVRRHPVIEVVSNYVLPQATVVLKIRLHSNSRRFGQARQEVDRYEPDVRADVEYLIWQHASTLELGEHVVEILGFEAASLEQAV